MRFDKTIQTYLELVLDLILVFCRSTYRGRCNHWFRTIAIVIWCRMVFSTRGKRLVVCSIRSFPVPSFIILGIAQVVDLDLKIKFGSSSADFTNRRRLKCLHRYYIQAFNMLPWQQLRLYSFSCV